MEWRAFFDTRPFGHDVLHRMLAQLSQVVAATHGAQTTIEQFMPRVETDAEREARERHENREVSGEELVMMMPGGAELLKELREKELQKDGDHSGS